MKKIFKKLVVVAFLFEVYTATEYLELHTSIKAYG